MTYKENAEHLGEGSGINLRSQDRNKPKGARPDEAGRQPEDPAARD
jgi:hypothetical protein